LYVAVKKREMDVQESSAQAGSMNSTPDLGGGMDLGIDLGGGAVLPVGALLACALVAVVLAAGGWTWSWLTTASARCAAQLAGRAAVLGGATVLALATAGVWLGAATVPVILAGYLVVGSCCWLLRGGR